MERRVAMGSGTGFQPPTGNRLLEGDVLVAGLEIVGRRAARGTLLRASAPWPASTAAFSAAAQEDDLGVRPPDVDLGGVALVPVLVRPLVVPDAALEVDGAALRQVVAHHLGGLAEHLHPVPGHALLLLAALIGPDLVGG